MLSKTRREQGVRLSVTGKDRCPVTRSYAWNDSSSPARNDRRCCCAAFSSVHRAISRNVGSVRYVRRARSMMNQSMLNRSMVRPRRTSSDSNSVAVVVFPEHTCPSKTMASAPRSSAKDRSCKGRSPICMIPRIPVPASARGRGHTADVARRTFATTAPRPLPFR